MTPEELERAARAAQARACVTLGCERKRKLHYSRCEDCIRVLLDSRLPKPPQPIVIRRAEKFRLVTA